MAAVTTTWTGCPLAGPGGTVTVIVADETTSTLVAAAAPKVTVWTLVNPDPVMVTRLPPVAGPRFATTEVTCGDT